MHVFAPDAVARARLARTLRELGIGLDDVVRVLRQQASLADVAATHASALGSQIRTLCLQRAVLRAVARSTDPEELRRMTDLTTLSAGERRRILDDYLDAVFGDDPSAVADKLGMGAPELPDDPTPDQIAAWVELVGLLRDPEFVAASSRMAQRARAESPEPDVAQVRMGKAVGDLAEAAARDGVNPASPEALQVVERIEGIATSTAGSGPTGRRTTR